MKFCRKCRSVLTETDDGWTCDGCGWELQRETETQRQGVRGRESGMETEKQTGAGRETGTTLETLPTTDSGSIRKEKAMEWLHGLEPPTDDELRRSVTSKPKTFAGSTFASDVSNVRVTGDAAFVETFAGLLEPLLALEGERTRLEVNLKETEDRDSGESTGNYALYLSVADR